MSDRYTFHEDSPREENLEREEGYRLEPLRLTEPQRARLLDLLSEEIGPVSAEKLLERIEREV